LVNKYKQSRHKHPHWKGYGKISGSFFSNIKRKAKSRGIKFNISIKYIWGLYERQEGKCALSGLSLSLPKNSRSDRNHTASLDRINSKKGYIKGNVQWLFKDINLIKWHFPQKHFLFLCNKITKNMRK